jgi:two-component system NtrC family response regulator
MAQILIIDDDVYIQDILSINAEQLGHEALAAGTLADGLAHLEARPFDLVFLDVRLPDGDGLDVIAGIRDYPSVPEVIIITGAGESAGAELAIRNGAWDYLQKPLSSHEIRLQMSRSLEYRKHTGQTRKTVSLKRDMVVGNDPRISTCLDQVAQCADSTASVLITGETGTGKELFARVIHENSSRAKKPFVVVDCAALPEQLVESLLFGHDKGAFTGADRARKGLVSEADGGTLFLDEVGELPLSVQGAFLRVLQEHRFRPVGMKKEMKSDFRLISATNRNLEDEVASGGFRKDLLYRLRTVHIDLPPLRGRKKDINELTIHYIYMISKRMGTEIKGMTPEFINILKSHDWPGNVRELISALETAVLADPKNTMLYPMHLPAKVRLRTIQKAIDKKKAKNDKKSLTPPALEQPDLSSAATDAEPPTLKEYRDTILEEAEKSYLSHLMAVVRGDIKRACRVSALSQSRLYFLLKKYNISRF